MKRHRWLAILMGAAIAGASTGCLIGGSGDAPQVGAAPGGTAPPGGVPSPVPPSSPASANLTFGQLFDRVRSGVVRVEMTSCDAVGAGSGFLVAPTLVATAAHVVAGASTISLRSDRGVVRGEVVGIDRKRDIALVRSVRPISGHVFRLSPVAADEQQDIAVLGYPAARPLSINSGQITGLDRRLDDETTSMTGLIQHDAVTTHGNSGGPVIDRQGRVVGLNVAGLAQRIDLGVGGLTIAGTTLTPGIAYAVGARDMAGPLRRWRQAPRPAARPDCPPFYSDLATVRSRHPDAPAMAAALYFYFTAINEGEYDEAWARLSATVRAAYGSREAFEDEQSTSYVDRIDVWRAQRVDDLTNVADVVFRSTQDPAYGPRGQRCTMWSLQYTLRIDAGIWRIERARSQEDPRRCEPNEEARDQ